MQNAFPIWFGPTSVWVAGIWQQPRPFKIDGIEHGCKTIAMSHRKANSSSNTCLLAAGRIQTMIRFKLRAIQVVSRILNFSRLPGIPLQCNANTLSLPVLIVSSQMRWHPKVLVRFKICSPVGSRVRSLFFFCCHLAEVVRTGQEGTTLTINHVAKKLLVVGWSTVLYKSGTGYRSRGENKAQGWQAYNVSNVLFSINAQTWHDGKKQETKEKWAIFVLSDWKYQQ